LPWEVACYNESMLREEFPFALALWIPLVIVHGTTCAETIDFGTENQTLPYSEDGLTFIDANGTSPVAVTGPPDDKALIAGTNVTPIYVRVQGDLPFTLIALDIEGLFRAWELRSSKGDIYQVEEVGTFAFFLEPSWQEIDYFDIVHLPAQTNGTIHVDNIRVQYVPEPSALWLICGAAAGGLFRRTPRRA